MRRRSVGLLVACYALVVAGYAEGKPVRAPMRLKRDGAILTQAPGATISPDGCVLSLLFDTLAYQRSAGTKPLVGKTFRQVWRLSLVQPAKSGRASADIRGYFARPNGVTATLGLSFGAGRKAVDLPATPSTADPNTQDPTTLASLVVPTPTSAGETTLVIDLTVRELADARPEETLIQVDSIDLVFQGCRAVHGAK